MGQDISLRNPKSFKNVHNKVEQAVTHQRRYHQETSPVRQQPRSGYTPHPARNKKRLDQFLENVEDFKYLGSVKTIDGSCSKDIKMRIGKAKKKMIELNNVWKDHNIPIELKLKLLNV
ncbi:hypothetical protein ElyMa_001702000 [Elysia marginata]|uniref:Enkurin domain-containing protein n=1 Tax=Elysia marginata TaxID=1093978 RepID=A0AAV4JWS1_9GAST|nr:hypothetical protein ElyMa_001702000 [Elysia marginata]